MALLGILALFGLAHRDDAALYLGGLTGLAIVVAVLIGALALEPTGPVGKLLALAPLVAIGRISYGIYLWHWPIFRWLHQQELGLSWGWTQLVRIVVTLAVATASFFLVERPLLRLRHRFDAPPSAPAAAAARSASLSSPGL